MATLVMPQAVGLSTGSCSMSGILNARRCTPAAAAFSGCISSIPRLPVLGLRSRPLRQRGVVCALTEEKEKEKENEKKRALEKDDAESVTKKFGLEAGLWKIFTTKEDGEGEVKGKRTNQAKVLLARYGGAYLATSISLSLVSFALCYFLVQSGVDVPALLEKIGIHASGTGEKVGTFALAYAAHKAASPIRFPPTVALTPIVAGWFGKKPVDEKTESK